METLDSIEESCVARLAENCNHYRALLHRIRALLRRDKERYVRGLTEDVECYLNANDLRPVYQVLKKLYSTTLV